MPTNILSLPLLTAANTNKNNESWRDGLAFTTAGSITGQANTGNSGNGTLASLSVAFGAYIGDYVLTLTSATAFRVTDPDGYAIGAGIVAVPFSASGITFTLNQGAVLFATGDGFVLSVLPQPLDITGIQFMMSMRRTAQDATILLSADTDLGTLVNGGASGVLGFAIPAAVMERVAPSPDGSPYVYDILAIADGDQRCCVDGKATILPGITIPTD